jgi:hypothetical protein
MRLRQFKILLPSREKKSGLGIARQKRFYAKHFYLFLDP